MKVTTGNDRTLRAIRDCLAACMPSGGRAVLFGSRARGTARAESDWDVLLLLDKDALSAADYDAVSFPLTMLGWELGKEINPVLYTAREWRGYKGTPFYQNVEREGVAIWG